MSYMSGGEWGCFLVDPPWIHSPEMEAAGGLDPLVASEQDSLHAYGICIDRLRLCSLIDGQKDDYRCAHQSRLLQASAGVATTVI
jgi:hypothetical protein